MLVCIHVWNRKDYEQFLRMQFFNGEEISSDVIWLSEVMYWNIQLSLSESIEYCPFEKGTSNENEIREVLSKYTVCVLAKES